MGGAALFSLRRLERHVNELSAHLLPSAAALSEAQSGFLQARLATLRAIIASLQNDEAGVASQRGPLEAAYQKLDEGLKSDQRHRRVRRGARAVEDPGARGAVLPG